MAKMTKKAAADLALADVRGIVPPPLDILEKAEWSDLRAQARKDAAAARLEQPGLSAEHAETYIDAYAEALLAKYAGVIKAQERKRNEWQRALRGQTLEQATAKAKALLRSFNVRGAAADDGYPSCTLHVRRAWALEADLYVRFERSDVRTENPDDARQRAGTYAVRIEISWGSTGRDVAGALAAATLYRELAEIGAEIEVVMRSEQIVWTYGVEDGKAEL